MATVLVIDDAEDLCFLLVQILRQKGMVADSVHTLSAASVAINNKFYSIIIIDNNLPDGLGADFSECIKKDSPNSKIIMITAFDGYKEKAFERGVDFYLSKPFTKSAVWEIIDILEKERI